MGSKCVQCGYCCTIGCCSYGIWDAKKNQCQFLTDNNLCAIYDKVKNDEFSPAMGAGCSSSLFNTRREAKVADEQNVQQA